MWWLALAAVVAIGGALAYELWVAPTIDLPPVDIPTVHADDIDAEWAEWQAS